MDVTELLTTAQPAIFGLFFIFLGFTALLFGLCAWVPRFMVRLNSVPWAFHLRRNLDVNYQGVLYAAFHTGKWAQVTHYSLAWDVVFWFVLVWALSPILVPVVLALLIVQAALLGDKQVAITLSFIWLLVAALAWGVGTFFGWATMTPLAMVILIAGSILRFFGHVREPVPPGMVNETDQFVPLKDARPALGLIMSPLVGTISEFAAGLPFRLFVVQGVWFADRIGMASTKKGAWERWTKEAKRLHKQGWRSSATTDWMRSSN